MDFSRIDVSAGTVGADYYLWLNSSENISISDIELMNGMTTSVTTIRDDPTEKQYRIVAVLTNEPDMTRYPFDRHTLSVVYEPKLKNEREMDFVIDNASSGLYYKADVPGWTLTGTRFYVTNETYSPGGNPIPM